MSLHIQKVLSDKEARETLLACTKLETNASSMDQVAKAIEKAAGKVSYTSQAFFDYCSFLIESTNMTCWISMPKRFGDSELLQKIPNRNVF